MLQDGTANIIAACKANGVQRISVVTTIGAGDSMTQAPWAFRLLMMTVVRQARPFPLPAHTQPTGSPPHAEPVALTCAHTDANGSPSSRACLRRCRASWRTRTSRRSSSSPDPVINITSIRLDHKKEERFLSDPGADSTAASSVPG